MSPSPNGNKSSPDSSELNNNGKLSSMASNAISSIRKRGQSCKPSNRLIHGMKVGLALVLVSLLYMLDPLFDGVGENAMWAIMTVVVIFEFTAGATLSKGINRAIGTILGGGLGCVAAILGDEVGGTGKAIVVGTTVFIIGAAATYSRSIPKIKRRYDYGAMIFILTFSLVAVSGLRADRVLRVAKQRLSTIGMGFAVCIFTSLLVYPIWASDQLHESTASKFEKLASCISECLEEYFTTPQGDNTPKKANVSGCKAVLHSKSTDELLANFAKWEPWHGKFGLSYPWDKYLEIGEVLRELAALILSLKECIQSSRQPMPSMRVGIREPCEIVGLSLSWMLRELGESVLSMKICRAKTMISPKLHSIKLELGRINSGMQTKEVAGEDEDDENENGILGISSLVFLLMEIADKIGVVAEKVEQLGEIAYFQTKNMDV